MGCFLGKKNEKMIISREILVINSNSKKGPTGKNKVQVLVLTVYLEIMSILKIYHTPAIIIRGVNPLFPKNSSSMVSI